MNPAGLTRMLVAVLPLAILTLAGCASAVQKAPEAPPAMGHAYVVGGHVTGLRGIGLALRSTRGEEINVDDDGKFVFGARLEDGTDYVVSIVREPISPVQTCVVEKGAGKIAAHNAMQITVVCSGIALDEVDPAAGQTASR